MANDKPPDHDIEDPLGEYCRTAINLTDNPKKQIAWVLQLTTYTEPEIVEKIKEIKREKRIN